MASSSSPNSDTAPMSRRHHTVFRPCIDLHNGQVKQIVGGSLRDEGPGPTTNFVADQSAADFAAMYRKDGLTGGHVIKLGKGNDEAARAALAAWPNGLHIGGGITTENARTWIDAGAEKIIVTSFLFDADGVFSEERCRELVSLVGRERLVLDLSCRRRPDRAGWFVTINRWQTTTDLELTKETLERLATYASEFLVHAADVEGLCQGIDEELVRRLGEWSPIPCTYAGGAKTLEDLTLVDTLSGGRVDLTFGSALDVFGGKGVCYADCVAHNKHVRAAMSEM
eukprot:m.95754 g.95754  ORF g.95754 m.95754 type:complete len:283 (+) comp10121_c0_seq3:308-1156(+)